MSVQPAVLQVRLHGTTLGTLTRLPDDRNIFTFDPSYGEDPSRATLSLSFKDVFGGLITNHAPTQSRLPPFFANLLPEGSLRDYLARRAGVKNEREPMHCPPRLRSSWLKRRGKTIRTARCCAFRSRACN